MCMDGWMYKDVALFFRNGNDDWQWIDVPVDVDQKFIQNEDVNEVVCVCGLYVFIFWLFKCFSQLAFLVWSGPESNSIGWIIFLDVLILSLLSTVFSTSFCLISLYIKLHLSIDNIEKWETKIIIIIS